jgi:hypothetical protein
MRRLRLVLPFIVLLAVPATAAAGPGFTVPSGNTTCGMVHGEQAASGRGLYCYSSYLTTGATYDHVGVVKLGRSDKARRVGAGNDLLLYIGGYTDDDTPRAPRPVLAYGERFERRGYTCTSRRSGLNCKRGAHGFFLSRERQRLF